MPEGLKSLNELFQVLSQSVRNGKLEKSMLIKTNHVQKNDLCYMACYRYDS